MRPPRAIVVAALLAFGAGRPADAGDDDKPKPAGPPTVALHLTAEKTYAYVFTEKVHATSTTHAADHDTPTDQRSESTWEIEIRLVAARPDGGATVSVKVVRLHGTYESLSIPKREFDSSKDRFGETSFGMCRSDLTVTLSPAGRVLDVAGAAADEAAKPPAKDAALARRAVAERFFQSSPATPARTGTTWEESRAIAPDLVGSGQHLVGEAVEKAIVKSAVVPALKATLAAKGKNKVAHRKPGAKADAKPARLGVLEEWSLAGDCTVDMETGLVTLRATHVEASTYSDLIALRDLTLETHIEYDTHLEAVAPK